MAREITVTGMAKDMTKATDVGMEKAKAKDMAVTDTVTTNK
jgi:hypothetical protein